MTLARQRYQAHLERQRRLGKLPPTPENTASPPVQPLLQPAPALAPQREQPLFCAKQARTIKALQKEVAELSARLKAIVREDDSPLVMPSRIKSVITAVAEYYRISLNDIVCHRRSREVALPRQVAMYLAKELTTNSLPEIGRVLDRDHSTILHGCRKIATLRLQDPVLDTQIRELTDLLTPPPGNDFALPRDRSE